jgi:hypothetical protein
MSTTPFDNIYDLFLVEIQDYNINALSLSSPTNFKIYLQGFLIKAIPDFDNCVQDLQNNYDTTLNQFNLALTLTEQTILANLMTIKWLNKQINNVTQFNLLLNDTDFKRYSEAQNLTAKVSHRDRLREIVDHDMLKYSLKNTNWTNWQNGVYT